MHLGPLLSNNKELEHNTLQGSKLTVANLPPENPICLNFATSLNCW